MKVLLCVTGSISAYKTPSIANALRHAGCDVKIVLTESSLKFIGKLSFTAQGFETFVDVDEETMNNVLHIDLITWADKVLIAPASANTIAKIASGFADNLLTSIIRAFPFKSEKSLLIAPAMNTDMYMHPLTLESIYKISTFFENSERFLIIEPVKKTLACGVTGKGALADSKTIVESTLKV